MRYVTHYMLLNNSCIRIKYRSGYPFSRNWVLLDIITFPLSYGNTSGSESPFKTQHSRLLCT